jgi:hypothetical protein
MIKTCWDDFRRNEVFEERHTDPVEHVGAILCELNASGIDTSLATMLVQVCAQRVVGVDLEVVRRIGRVLEDTVLRVQ